MDLTSEKSRSACVEVYNDDNLLEAAAKIDMLLKVFTPKQAFRILDVCKVLVTDRFSLPIETRLQSEGLLNPKKSSSDEQF